MSQIDKDKLIRLQSARIIVLENDLRKLQLKYDLSENEYKKTLVDKKKYFNLYEMKCDELDVLKKKKSCEIKIKDLDQHLAEINKTLDCQKLLMENKMLTEQVSSDQKTIERLDKQIDIIAHSHAESYNEDRNTINIQKKEITDLKKENKILHDQYNSDQQTIEHLRRQVDILADGTVMDYNKHQKEIKILHDQLDLLTENYNKNVDIMDIQIVTLDTQEFQINELKEKKKKVELDRDYLQDKVIKYADMIDARNEEIKELMKEINELKSAKQINEPEWITEVEE
ncbi:MAG: hypothetical protein Edafosvirus58_4 [Edafosvirus sp.]|uniref:Uncharacterized protein n=1 Tax=Edafosvirus sp. TaxID=2487765 RepID=A0A3G4ZZF1_9VIRU|nr:MAG: hypothetical protein Edafosvirus58_4 [Edafosvirus sp.]